MMREPEATDRYCGVCVSWDIADAGSIQKLMAMSQEERRGVRASCGYQVAPWPTSCVTSPIKTLVGFYEGGLCDCFQRGRAVQPLEQGVLL